jgi:hypothetical protein
VLWEPLDTGVMRIAKHGQRDYLLRSPTRLGTIIDEMFLAHRLIQCGTDPGPDECPSQNICALGQTLSAYLDSAAISTWSLTSQVVMWLCYSLPNEQPCFPRASFSAPNDHDHDHDHATALAIQVAIRVSSEVYTAHLATTREYPDGSTLIASQGIRSTPGPSSSILRLLLHSNKLRTR